MLPIVARRATTSCPGQTPIIATDQIRGQRYANTQPDVAMLADLGDETD
jgi:hypothetical protein